MNIQTVVVLVVLAALLGLAVRSMWRSNRAGRCSGCNEEGCSGHGSGQECPSVAKALDEVDRKLGPRDGSSSHA